MTSSPIKLRCEKLGVPKILPRHRGRGGEEMMCEWTVVRPIVAARFVRRQDPTEYAIIHGSTRNPGDWQVSFFDAQGPWGDSQRSSIEEALAEVPHYSWRLVEWQEPARSNPMRRKHTNANLVRIGGETWRRTFAGDVSKGTPIRLHTEIIGRDGLHKGYAPSSKVIRYSGSLPGAATVWIRHEYRPVMRSRFGDREENPPYSGWVREWWEKPAPSEDKIAYQTKTDALNVFLDYNRNLVEDYGGESMVHSPASFDAINHLFGIKGKRRVDTIARAVWWAMPPGGPPWYLEDIDVELLNRTAPAIFNPRGLSFEIPDFAAQEQLLREEEAHYMERWEARDFGEDLDPGDFIDDEPLF